MRYQCPLKVEMDLHLIKFTIDLFLIILTVYH
jgi:polyisoprenoid-binding protein YceI